MDKYLSQKHPRINYDDGTRNRQCLFCKAIFNRKVKSNDPHSKYYFCDDCLKEENRTLRRSWGDRDEYQCKLKEMADRRPVSWVDRIVPDDH